MNDVVVLKHTFDQAMSLRETIQQAIKNYFETLTKGSEADVYNIALKQIELPLLQKIMEYTHDNQSQTAKILGLSRGTLRKKLKIHGML